MKIRHQKSQYPLGSVKRPPFCKGLLQSAGAALPLPTVINPWVTASTFISKLLAYPRQHRLTQMLVEYGRLIRSTFIPFYLDDPANRRRVLVQLNKGEEAWFTGIPVFR
jgi:hypothetical protein